MKRALMLVGVMALLGLILLALGSKAQAQTRQVLEANVPFEFNIGDTHFSSGSFEITEVSLTEMFRGRIGNQVVMFNAVQKTKPVEIRTSTRSFSGGHYFLSEVWEGTDGHQLQRSPTEIKLAKAMEAQTTDVSAVGK